MGRSSPPRLNPDPALETKGPSKDGLRGWSRDWGGGDCCNRSACCRVGRERMQEWRCAQTGREVGGRENFRSESTEAPLAPDGDTAVARGGGLATYFLQVLKRTPECTTGGRADKHTSSRNFGRNILLTANCSRKSKNNLSSKKEVLL